MSRSSVFTSVAETSAPVAAGRWVRDQYGADVSVVIVNYNSRAMLERTLATLFDSGPRHSLEVIVIDNDSRDDSVAMVEARFPGVRCIVNQENVGLTRANNQGMLLANGRFILLLNNDTIIQAGAVDALADYLTAQPSVGGVGGTVLNIDGSRQGTVKAHPTPLVALFGRRSLLTRLWPNNPVARRYLTYRSNDYSHPFPAGSVSSCAMLVRREAIEAAGLIDERYFVYWSDVDWCRAIWEAGFAIHCVPASVIIHDEHKGGTRSARRRSWASIVDFHRGAYVYYCKWPYRPPWHPLALLAAAGLAGRALVVLAGEQVSWTLRSRKGTPA